MTPSLFEWGKRGWDRVAGSAAGAEASSESPETHEATHLAQQRGAATSGYDDAHELEMDVHGAAVPEPEPGNVAQEPTDDDGSGPGHAGQIEIESVSWGTGEGTAREEHEDEIEVHGVDFTMSPPPSTSSTHAGSAIPPILGIDEADEQESTLRRLAGDGTVGGRSANELHDADIDVALDDVDEPDV